MYTQIYTYISDDVSTNELLRFQRQPRFIIEDLGIHLLDCARAIMGEATSVAARIHRINPAIQGEDVATIMLGHENGGTSVIDCSYKSSKT